MQFSTTPLRSGYMPVSSMPRWGLLTGKLLTASVSTVASRAKRSRLGVTTGSPFHPTSAANSGSLQKPSEELRYWSGKT